MSVRESIDRAPMSAYQVLVVAICLLIVLAEGYDLLIMAFSASGIAQEWTLSGAQTGVLLSAALFGMAFGSAFLAPLADRIGRRLQTLGCLLIVTVSMGLAALSSSFVELGAWRVLTGLGIGGLVASLPVVVAEFSPQRRRTTMIALYTIGLPLGGAVGGLIATALLATHSWRASFAVGAGITFMLFLVVLVAMPESIDYLLVRRPKGALASINRTLRRMHSATIDEIPVAEMRPEDTVRAAVFRGRNGVRSALLCFAFFVMMAGFYFATSWTPRLLEQSGFSAQQGISGGMLLNLGGATAALLFGLLALRFRVRALTIVVLIGAAVSFVAMSLSLGNLGVALIFAVVVGGFTNASASGMFALAPACYPAAVRSTAVGLAAAVGRVGAILAPIVAGVLMDLGWAPPALFLFFAVPLVLGAVAVAMLRLPDGAEVDAAGSTQDAPAQRRSPAAEVGA